MDNVGIVIQARMGSSRLPGKVLRSVGNKTLLGYIFDRLRPLSAKFPIIVATSTQKTDDLIESYCKQHDVSLFRGDEHDVLDRYNKASQEYGLDHIVRLTADNPFPDVTELTRLVEFHLKHNNDFSHCLNQMPIGVGSEIFSGPALYKSAINGRLAHHREHVDEYILENQKAFKVGQLKVPKRKVAPKLRVTIDTSEDLEFVNKLLRKCGSAKPNTMEIIRLCSASV